jgi:hypothetical protein
MNADTDNLEPGFPGPAAGNLPPDNRTPSSADPPRRDKLTLSMELCEVYLGMGQDAFERLVRSISIGKLKTYQIYEGFKVRAHLPKVNTELLRKGVPRFWARLEERDEEFGKDLAQAILVSHLDMISAVLDFLGVPHESGFFAKDMDPKPYFAEGWEDRVCQKFRERFPDPVLVFYVNHLRWELLGATELYRPASPSAA